jgi:hypothetical protein
MKRPILLGLITAIPIPSFLVCVICILVRMNHDTRAFGLTGVIFVVSAGVGVLLHLAMFFYYLIQMQRLKAVNQDHYLAWLPALMAPGGQFLFWYLFFWKPSAAATAHSA